MRYHRFGIAAVVVVLGALLQWRVPPVFGVKPDFALAALVSAGLFLSWRELIPLAFGAAWALNWRPAVGWEIGWFAAVPFLLAALSRFSPLRRWVTNAAAVFLAVLLFYLGVDYALLPRLWEAVLLQAAIGSVVGAFFFLVMRSFDREKEAFLWNPR